MIIAAVSDIHSPRNYELFVRSIDNLTDKIDLFVLAGDIVDQGNVDEYQKIINAFFGKVNCPKIACFGNSEYGKEQTDKIKIRYSNEIVFLDDESIILEIQGKKIGIVGTKGSLDRPTYWQYKNIPGIEEEYRNRVNKVKELLNGLDTDLKILVTHYAPTYKILEGENINAYPELGSQLMEDAILQTKPNLVICGHAHKGKKIVRVDSVPVFNAGIVLNGRILTIDTEKDLKFGLERFI
ncbi:MAG: metallophosphoesterase [Candidatus Aenigmarchaeota archaeon]|nr:metallophosphoesterase [Candidatus Aenigmarchaeota archaeon]